MADVSATAKQIEGQFRKASASEEPDFSPIDDAFRHVELSLVHRHPAPFSGSKPASELFASLRTTLHGGICATCCAAEDRSCQWTRETYTADIAAVEKRGKCIEPARELFRFASHIAVEAYEPFMVAGREVVAIEFETRHISDRSSVLEKAIDGMTTEEVGPPLSRTVQAHFAINHFGPTDYLTLLYLLVHECVAHAYCGVPVATSKSDMSTAFHEGWMDEVAALLLEEAFVSPVPAYAGEGHLLHGAEYLDVMRRTRSTRLDCFRPSAHEVSIEWRVGTHAFRTFCEVIELVLKAQPGLAVAARRPSAVGAAVDLSLALNASNVSHEMRGSFVTKVSEHYDRPAGQLATAVLLKPQIIDALSAFFANQDVHALVGAVLAIPD